MKRNRPIRSNKDDDMYKGKECDVAWMNEIIMGKSKHKYVYININDWSNDKILILTFFLHLLNTVVFILFFWFFFIFHHYGNKWKKNSLSIHYKNSIKSLKLMDIFTHNFSCRLKGEFQYIYWAKKQL